VSTIDLLKNIAGRLNKYKILILVAAIICAIGCYIPELNKKTIYTAKATLFPMNSDNEGSSSSSLSSLLGLNDATKSFGNDNSVNILELTVSRTLMQTVASKRLPAFNNKTIAELLVAEKNNSASLFTSKMEFPADSVSQAILGSALLSGNFTAKINKNNVLELYYSNTNASLLEPVTDTIIVEITKFYTDLKIQKALSDYNFTVAQLDSVQRLLDKLDSKAIGMQNTTLFTSDKLLAYQIPKNYVADAKDIATHRKDLLINNKEEAMWRLQKITPIVEILDKPQPPFASKRSTPTIMAILGFLIGAFLAAFIVIAKLLYEYAKAEIHKAFTETTT
jgi:uncharacterized protein involved in exopolysaccharide biosynthesis